MRSLTSKHRGGSKPIASVTQTRQSNHPSSGARLHRLWLDRLGLDRPVDELGLDEPRPHRLEAAPP